MKQLIIVGAGGCGREVLQWVKDINKGNKQWEIKGFIDDDLHALDSKNCDYSVIGTIKEYQPQPEHVLVCGIASPRIKEIVTKNLIDRGAEFVTVIHPTALVSDNASIGYGCVLSPYTIVTADSVLEEFVYINSQTSIGHDVHIGRYTTASVKCDITGHVTLGQRVFLGSSVAIVPSVRVGDDAYLCAGSVVMTRVKENTKMLGNPARKFAI